MTYYSDYNPEYDFEKLLPDGTVNLIIELDEQQRFTIDRITLSQHKKCIRAWVSGMQREYVMYCENQGSRMFVIQFKAGGCYPFIHFPVNELTDLIVDAEMVFGEEILFLREQLFIANSPAEMFSLASNWLLNRAKSGSMPEAVIQFAAQWINRCPTESGLNKMIEKTGYTQKHIIQIFKKYLGLTPKLYQRIVRFNKALEEIELTRKIDWVQLSLDCGYFDQAHFINEFNHFSGMNPTQYLVQKGEYLNYIPVQIKR
ncbi:MAG: helix-turn-helix transcriptional regulator [Bacteroidales bacterium]|nr:helix-turn-helix transcriptional regulator [Bacteroidales bacterium]